MSERKSLVKFSCRCGRGWDGLTQAHCATCHRHFGSVAAFDMHRQGSADDRFCADPEIIVRGEDSKHAGRPRLRAAESPHGVVWISDNPEPHPMALQHVRGPGTGNGARPPDRQEAP